jgi:hypothetical protein
LGSSARTGRLEEAKTKRRTSGKQEARRPAQYGMLMSNVG